MCTDKVGIYLNPKKRAFQKALNSQIYVDKSELIAYTNQVLNSEQQYICVSRPRRFGKSMAANMLAAYYGRSADSREEFEHLKIGKEASFRKYLNRYNVIFLNMQEFLSDNSDIEAMEQSIEDSLLWELSAEYPDIHYSDRKNLIRTLYDIFDVENIPFIFIIDEWDCIFREKKEDKDAQSIYLNFLINLLKDKSYITLVYMTGILPVGNCLRDSEWDMFNVFSMTNSRELAEFVGFTEKEVEVLCTQYGMNFEETRQWYDGYRFKNADHIYCPISVVKAMLSKCFDDYWNQTETFEALKDYITMDYGGLKDTVIELLAGKHQKIDISSFSNDMITFSSADDVLTLLVHLGYLGYDCFKREVFIPNAEIRAVFITAVKNSGWQEWNKM